MKGILTLKYKRILISRTDSIGDVMLALPMAAWLKEKFEGVEVLFMGQSYTSAVIESFSAVDRFLDWKEVEKLTDTEQITLFKSLKIDAIVHAFPRKEIAKIAKKAKITYRIGTSHRLFHLLTCNVRLNFTRKNSELHESQLNFELLRPFGLTEIPSLDTIEKYISLFHAENCELPDYLEPYLTSPVRKIILHPKSQGSAVEWPLGNYATLAQQLAQQGYTVFFTGTEKEGQLFRSKIEFSERIVDTSGTLSLKQLIYLISKSDTLLACSTGPLHIAGFLGIHALGLFSPKRPIHPGRWKALGKNVEILLHAENCPSCQRGEKCRCIEKIEPAVVFDAVNRANRKIE